MRLSPPLVLATSATALPTFLTFRSPLASILPTLSVRVNLVFGVQVQTSDPASTTPISLLVSGYQIPLPLPAQSGLLISWLANYENSTPYNTQLNYLNPSAPRNITTDSASATPQDGGPSLSNTTASTDGRPARVITSSYSTGDAASAAAAALDGTTPSGDEDEDEDSTTAVATSNALAQILIATTSANTAAVLNTPSLQNANAAASSSSSSCAADLGPVSSSSSSPPASTLNSVYIPVATAPNGQGVQWLKSEAVAACTAGVDAPMVDEGGSAGSLADQASLVEVAGLARCDGVGSVEMDTRTMFRVVVVGVYTLGKGFSGAVGGERVAESGGQC